MRKVCSSEAPKLHCIRLELINGIAQHGMKQTMKCKWLFYITRVQVQNDSLPDSVPTAWESENVSKKRQWHFGHRTHYLQAGFVLPLQWKQQTIQIWRALTVFSLAFDINFRKQVKMSLYWIFTMFRIKRLVESIENNHSIMILLFTSVIYCTLLYRTLHRDRVSLSYRTHHTSLWWGSSFRESQSVSSITTNSSHIVPVIFLKTSAN